MSQPSPIWPAALDHLRLDSPDPDALAAFYRDAMGMTPVRLDADLILLDGPQRRLLIGKGARNGQPFSALALESSEQLEALRASLQVELSPAPTPLFDKGAFAVTDPDGRQIVFGLPSRNFPAPSRSNLRAAQLNARLQHVVVATADLDRLTAFYNGKLGFLISDTVCAEARTDPDAPAAVNFFRADKEHHSFAAFLAPNARSDHHCYETSCWNDIRDWADHLCAMGIIPWWGPGRHGVGHNLFFMVKDPDGNNVELSAEIEIMPRIMPGRRWPNTDATINAWGVAWNRMTSTG